MAYETQKLNPLGAWPRSHDQLSKFWESVISREWIAVRNSDFTDALSVALSLLVRYWATTIDPPVGMA